MDDSVVASLAKWPNVPSCHRWLSLDARGSWRIGDPVKGPRERIRHPGLHAFLARNYACDPDGAWYCQNGPQRVFVDLPYAPWALHMSSTSAAVPAFITHAGTTVETIQALHLCDDGFFYLATDLGLAVLDDRDSLNLLAQLRFRDQVCNDADVLEWIEQGRIPDGVQLSLPGHTLALGFVSAESLPDRYGFKRTP